VTTFTIPIHDVDRAIAEDEEAGFVKIHVRERTDRILGATIVARHAGEMINEITLAMVAQAAAIWKAADAHTRARLTPTIQSLLRRWLTW
jgi:pyruvate/2-oxoglutarate dehydrogenase complex dihydrolipoamide dehydrogenase (E3) component